MIKDIEKINKPYLYIAYKKYDYKFGDLDLMFSGGIFGNSQLNFGLFCNDAFLQNNSAIPTYYNKK